MESLVEYSQVAIGGMAVIPMVIGLMQFAKKLGLQGNKLVITAFGVLSGFGGVAGAVSEGLIPAPVLPWIRVVMFGLGFAVYGMAAMGLYDLSKVFRTPAVEGSYPPSGR